MPIHIEEINAKNLGPMEEFSNKLGLVNLIYGHNEHGKTFLVEFIIRSLFENKKSFNLRSLVSKGKILVSGLGDDVRSFSPGTNEKLDDFLEDFRGGGLPTDYSKLLVVKGAELELDAKISGGMNKDSIKKFLSSEEFLDNIRKDISKTILNAEVSEDRIVGAKRGVFKERGNHEEEIAKLVLVFDNLTNNISFGEYQEYVDEKKALEIEIKSQEKAKRYKAYKVSQSIMAKKTDFDQFERKNFSELGKNIDAFDQSKNNTKGFQKSLDSAISNSQNYNWLKSALSEYERLTRVVGGASQGPSTWAPFVFWAGLVAIVLGAGISYLGTSSFVSISMFLVGIIGIIISGTKLLKRANLENQSALVIQENIELVKLQAEFLSRIDSKLSSKASIKESIDAEAESFHSIAKFREDILREEGKQRNSSSSAINILKTFGLDGDKNSWSTLKDELEEKKSLLDQDIRILEMNLSQLNVPEELYINEFKGNDYLASNALLLQEKLLKVNETIDDLDDTLLAIKSKSIALLGLEEPVSWEEVLHNINNSTIRAKANLEDIEADIIASYVLGKVIDKIKLDEDAKIARELKSKNITEPISTITGTYNGIKLEGDEIWLSTEYDDFPLSDLSTGARQQVLLGIRIGLISRLFGNNPGFLVLDDAFQHSDYPRRDKIVEKLFDLAKNNWQTIYFSMDDHIASLFDKKGKPLKSKYKRFDI